MGTSMDLRTDAGTRSAVPNPVGPRPDAGERLAEGTWVEVRTRFDGRWAAGFRVAAADGEGYLIARRSDGQVLPVLFGHDEIRLGAPASGPGAALGA